jgi:formylglycine-generating enzyme
MRNCILRIIVLLLFLLPVARTALAVDIAFVTVGDAGNAADPDTGYGRVDYDYRIGKYDVTAGQYCEFLNAVAKGADPYGLYNANMNVVVHNGGCNIIRSGAAGNYGYSVAADWANRPVNFVSWGDAARFCNWLNNGQLTGNAGAASLEYGAYTLGGANTDTMLIQVTRNLDSKYFIPSLNEWYKAAYFDPNKNGAGQPGYWLTPLKHGTLPSNILDPAGTNNANFFDLSGTGNHSYTIGGPYWRTEVGAFASSPSPWGTFDQGGNVGNFVESPADATHFRAFGTDFASVWTGMSKWDFDEMYPTDEVEGGGFRIGAPGIPEPSVLLMLLIGAMAGLFWWNRSK